MKIVIEMALEALENSVDLVREDAYQAEKLYGNYPTRQGKVNGLKVLADDHEKAITAIKEALAQPQPPPVPPPWWPAVENILNEYGLQAIDFVADFKEALAQPEQEPVQFKCTVIDDVYPNGIPLEQWTSPPQRKPLTDEQMAKALPRPWPDEGDRVCLSPTELRQFANGIKENT